jgi:hypothetical protein
VLEDVSVDHAAVGIGVVGAQRLRVDEHDVRLRAAVVEAGQRVTVEQQLLEHLGTVVRHREPPAQVAVVPAHEVQQEGAFPADRVLE